MIENPRDKINPYSNDIICIGDLTPEQFKKSFNGVYSQYFKYIKDHHNRYLAIKTVGKLFKLMREMNYRSIIYKITQMKDEYGHKINCGGILKTKNKKRQCGNIRIGRAIEIIQRLRSYMSYSLKPRNPFEAAIRTLNIKSFKIEILAVCKTEKESVATEYFWQLYFNRCKSKKGYDLGKNSYFNPVLGSRPDFMIPYFIPKWEITLYILKGFEKREMRLIFGKRFGVRYISPETLDTRFKTYYGTRNFYKIKLKLLKPILDRCLRYGYLIDRTLSCLIECGIEFVKKRKNKRKCLTNFLIKIYGDPGGTNKYRRIREELFVKPYTNHLKRIKIRKRMIRPTILRDYLSGRYLKRKDYNESNWSIIEYLFARNCSSLDIANGLNLCSNEDSQLVRNKAAIKIKEYLRSRWRYSLKRNEIEFNYDNLRKYLQSFEHEKDIYNNFISVNKA